MQQPLDRLPLLLKEYESDPTWIPTLHALIISCSINQANCINEQHRDDDIRISAHNILYNIAKNGGVSTQKELMESQTISKQALTLAVNALEERGYVERYVSDLDRRIRYIRLTERGLDFLFRTEKKRVQFFEAFCEYVTPEEGKIVTDILKKVNAFYKDYIDRA